MSDLSKDEKKQLCEDVKAYQKKHKLADAENTKLMCNARAAMSTMPGEGKDTAAVRASCKKELEACLAKNEPPKDDKEIDCSSDSFLGQMGECTEMTVGELGECMTDMVGRLKTFAGEDPCSGLEAGDKDSFKKFFDKMKSPKCVALEAKCKGKKSQGGDASGGDDDDKVMAEAISKMEDFQGQVCACKDKACADQVSDAMTKWGTEMAKKTKAQRPSAAMAKKSADIMAKYTDCLTKLLTVEPPAPTPK